MSQYPIPPLDLANKLQSLCGLIERSLYSIARESKEIDENKYESIRQMGRRFNLKAPGSITIPDAFDKYDEAYSAHEQLKGMHKAQIKGKTFENLSLATIEKTIKDLK